MDTPRLGHDPIDMRRLGTLLRPGDFKWELWPTGSDVPRYFIVLVPSSRPCGFCYSRIPVVRTKVKRAWEWDGDEDTPTLTPSLHVIGMWHGWVRRGQLIEA